MAILIDVDVEGEPCYGDVMCSECHAQFCLHFKRTVDVSGVCFCPFCGDEIVDETTDMPESEYSEEMERHIREG